MKRSHSDSSLERWREHLRPAKVAVPEQTDGPPQRVENERPQTISEAAHELGLSVHTIRAWVAERRLAHLRLGRAIRIPAAEIRRVIEQATVPAGGED